MPRTTVNTLRSTLVVLIYAVSILASSLTPFYAAHAAGETLSSPANKTGTPTSTVAVTDLSVAGSGEEFVTLNIYSAQGTFALGSTANITATGVGTHELTVGGTHTYLNAALATLTYSNSMPGEYTVQVAEQGSNGEIYNFENGHAYQIVASNGSWHSGKAAAETMSYGGASGYLTTLTSVSEHHFVRDRLNEQGKSYGWIGATDASLEGDWRWVTGPEAGTQFYTGGMTVPSMYSAWMTNEPSNNFDYNTYEYENCAHIWLLPGSEFGKWNDFFCGNGNGIIDSYIVEYGAAILPEVMHTSFDVTMSDTPVDPTDHDGVDNAIEAAAPHNGDANGDDTPDNEQANVASFVNTQTQAYVSLELPADCTITGCLHRTREHQHPRRGLQLLSRIDWFRCRLHK